MEVTSATQNQTASQTASTGFANDFTTFLSLLTTQLQNQDPLEPLDSNEFTAQLVQFSGVEQQIQMNSNLEQLVSLQQNAGTLSSVSFIGKTITTPGNFARLEGGSANWTYDLAGKASETEIKVINDAGVLVNTLPGELEQGEHTFSWDGLDQFGEQAPDGVYTLEIAATDAAGGEIDVNTIVSGVVDSVRFDNGAPVLSVLGRDVLLTDVREITQ